MNRAALEGRSRIHPHELAPADMSCSWLTEPCIAFSGGALHFDPKVGIPLYGPRSLGTDRHKLEVHVGFIGTAGAIEHARQFYEQCAEGIDGDAEHSPFPGCKPDRGFRCALTMGKSIVEPITRHEQTKLLGLKDSRLRFESIVKLLEEKLTVLCRRDSPLDYVVLTLPEDVYRLCRTVDFVEKGHGLVHRDLRRAFKVLAMRDHKATQILLETTTGMSTRARQLDHRSVIAWNLFTGLYFKIGGLPWGPTGLAPSSCFVGISFFRPLGERSQLRTSVVQAFDENGEGLVLRGHDFNWDEQKHGKSPHLPEDVAAHLMTMVLERYKQERGQYPQRVVVHKSSRFEDPERRGFESALSPVSYFDLVALTPSSETRLIRAGNYPPLRGTAFSVGDTSYLYTSGYLRELGRYPHGHVPSPLQIADHVGDTSREQLLREVLMLTKMNWNSANMSGVMPITLRFSRLVGDILREVPSDQTPEPQYKYYM